LLILEKRPEHTEVSVGEPRAAGDVAYVVAHWSGVGPVLKSRIPRPERRSIRMASQADFVRAQYRVPAGSSRNDIVANVAAVGRESRDGAVRPFDLVWSAGLARSGKP
jgi:hypothetical protein